jgi:N-acetylglucosaminyldiphosphoundecaprenol N-acetyl-beta-D-mannosaminyltransferase
MRMEFSSVVFGPLTLARATRVDAVEWVRAQARAGRSCVVVTSNIHHLRLAERDAAFRDVVGRSELNVADGWPLVRASQLMRSPLPERVAGVDLVADVLATPARLRLAVIGGAPGAAELLAEAAARDHDIVLVDPLPRGTWSTATAQADLAARLADARAQVTLLGVGAPQQELLADRLRPAAAGPIICCGASIEILAGIRPRAPHAVQALGLEWAFRLVLEPTRLGPRYVAAGAGFLRVLARELRSRRASARGEVDDGQRGEE